MKFRHGANNIVVSISGRWNGTTGMRLSLPKLAAIGLLLSGPAGVLAPGALRPVVLLAAAALCAT